MVARRRMYAMKKLAEMNPTVRLALTALGAVDGVLRMAALRDLKRRDDADLQGNRKIWGLALAGISSGGVLPVAYFVVQRRS